MAVEAISYNFRPQQQANPSEARIGSVTTPEASIEPYVRSATIGDVSALARVELKAYTDVYGKEPQDSVVMTVHDKYRERIELLGDWIRVLESPTEGVYGVMVCCPTNLGKEDFLHNDRDMTQNETLREIYDPTGKSAYIVNLAVLPHSGHGGSIELFVDALQKGVAAGISHTFFESRLPGFERWCKRKFAALAPNKTTLSSDELADEYWQTIETRQGTEQPIDPLLRKYVSFGCKPLCLVKDAWKTDLPSKGYGVLCDFETPGQNEGDIKEHMLPVEVSADPLNEKSINFMGSALRWAKRHKKALLLGSAVAGLAYSAVTSSESDIISHVKEAVPWVGAAYATSLSAYVGGAGLMLAGTGQKFKEFFRRRASPIEMPGVAKGLAKIGFWVNSVGALAAAATAGVGVVEALPPEAWTALAIPAIDVYSTVVTRSLLKGKISR